MLSIVKIHKNKLDFYAIFLLTFGVLSFIIIIESEREVTSMSEELLKELLNRIEICQNNEIYPRDCAECPLYKTFGDGQNICLKLLEEKKE